MAIKKLIKDDIPKAKKQSDKSSSAITASMKKTIAMLPNTIAVMKSPFILNSFLPISKKEIGFLIIYEI